MAVFNGTEGRDVIRQASNLGQPGNEINGLGGDDILQGGNGDDLINGGDGNDNLSGGPAVLFASGVGNDVINGGNGNDLINGANGNDTLDGGDGNDRILAGSGDDDVFAGAGDDEIVDLGGNGTLRGEDGNDNIRLGLPTGGVLSEVTIEAGAGNDRVLKDSGLRAINAVVFAGTGDDFVDLKGNGNDILYGNGGNDSLNAGNGDDIVRGADIGRDEIDNLSGGVGADTFQLFNGTTILYDDGIADAGGTGDFAKILGFQRGQDQVEVIGDRSDYLVVNSPLPNGSNDKAIVFDTNNNQQFDRGLDELIAVVTNSDFSIDDLTVIDTPILNGTNGSNNLSGQLGKSGIFNARGGNDRVNGKDGDDLVRGGAGNDVLLGGTGDDTLLGEQGRDRLIGGAGDDILWGGRGPDKMIGGSGLDTYVLAPREGVDVIRFVDGQDRLALVGGLTFEQLSFTQVGANTVVGVGDARLAILQNTQVGSISQADFAQVELAASALAKTAVPIITA
jgi:Ca2+-binding RTX toxin-like protein